VRKNKINKHFLIILNKKSLVFPWASLSGYLAGTRSSPWCRNWAAYLGPTLTF